MNPYHKKSMNAKRKEHPVVSLVFFMLFFGILTAAVCAFGGFLFMTESKETDGLFTFMKYSALIGGFIGAVIAIPINVAYQTGNAGNALKISSILNYMFKFVFASSSSCGTGADSNSWRD